MDPDYEETMAELHGEYNVPIPNATIGGSLTARPWPSDLPYTRTLDLPGIPPTTAAIMSEPETISLDDQLAIVLPRIGTAFEVLAGWLLAGSIVGHVRDMVEPGLRDGYEVYRDDSFRLSQYELAVEAMEEIRDAIIYIAIMLEKEERGEEK